MATANTQYPLHQLDFVYDNGTEVSVNIVDSNGEPDYSQLVVQQSSRISAKVGTGGVSHSDYEFPFVPVQQRSNDGGRAQLHIEDDNTRFYDSMNIETTVPGHAFLSGLPRYSTGPRYMTQRQRLNNHQMVDLYGSYGLLQIPFTPGDSYDAKSVTIWATRVGSPGNATVALHTSAGDYAAAVSTVSGTLYQANANETRVMEEFVIDMGATMSLTADTKYWITIIPDDTGDQDNHWKIAYTTDTTGALYGTDSGDFSSYTSLSGQCIYRVTPEEYPFQAEFFRYKGATYAVLSYDLSADSLTEDGDPTSGTASVPKEVRLFINGDNGLVSSASSYSITDSTKSWVADEHVGAICLFHDGQAASVPQRWRRIIGNDSTSLLFDEPLTVVPDADADRTEYVILGSESWSELTIGPSGYGPRQRCTDVLVTHFCTYMCFGDTHPVLRMRRYPSDRTTWTTEWQYEHQGFTFMEQAANSFGVNKIWAAKGDFPPQVQYANPVWATWENDVDRLDFNYNRINSNSSCELTTSWSDVGSPTTNERGSSGSGWQGQYAWHVVTDADDEGAGQSVTVEQNKTYNLVAVVWIDSLPEDGRIRMRIDGDVIDSTPVNETTSSSWFRLKGHWTASANGSVVADLICDGGAGEFYFDEFEVVEIPTYLEDLSSDRITNLIRYGEPERCWALTEGGIYQENMGYFQRIPLDGYKNAQDDRNGKVAFVSDVNLLISFLDGLQAYYNESLDNISPHREEGFPKDRRGDVSFGIDYTGKYFIGMDAGSSGYSCVLCNNGRGWHEIYRGPKGKRIRNGFIQPMPGDLPDKLWISQGEDLVWIPILDNPLREV